MALIVLERTTYPGGNAQPDDQTITYYSYQSKFIEFDTVTKKVSERLFDFYVTDLQEVDYEVNNPFYINPATGFYTDVLTETTYRSWNYLGAGLVNYTDKSTIPAGGCTLAVVTPLAIKASTGGNNGEVTILYTGEVSNPENVIYSLDNYIWFTSNVFRNLAPGNYTAYVKDVDTFCTASAAFFIPDFISYGERYFLTFDQMFAPYPGALQQVHRKGKLQIFKKDYTGTPEDLTKGGPIVLNKAGNGKKYEEIKGTQADITLFSFTRQKFLDFFSADEREHRVDVSFDDKLYHRSWILPDVYREPFLSAVYEVSITASDGLNSLKNYPYTDAAGAPFAGEQTWLDIIFNCLAKLDLELPLRSVVDVYEQNMFETSDVNDPNPVISDPLFQAKVSPGSFFNSKGLPLDCETVLKRVLTSIKARIYQADGMMVVECVDAKRRKHWAVNYNADRSFKSYEIIDPVVLTVPPNRGGLQWINGEQSLDILPAWKNTVLESDMDVVENLVPGGDLLNPDFLSNAENFPGYHLKNWTATAPYYRYKESKTKNYITFNTPSPGPADFDAAHGWRSEYFPLKADGSKLYIKVQYTVFVHPDSNTIPNASAQVHCGTHSLNYSNEWVPFDPRVTTDLVPNVKNGISTFELITPPIPADGNYYLIIKEAQQSALFTPLKEILGFRLYSAALQMLPAGYKPNAYTFAEVVNPERYTFSPAPEQVYYLDTPASANYKTAHHNYIEVNGQQSSAWHIKGAPLPEEGTADSPLIALLAGNVAYNHERPSHTLSGTLLGRLSYQNSIKERWDKSRIFLIDGMQENLRFAQASVTLLELMLPPVVGESAGLLLEDQSGYFVAEDSKYILILEDYYG